MIVASCNGLLLTLFGRNLFIANPITKCSFKVPSLPYFVHTSEKKFVFAYHHSAKEYKVVCIFVEYEPRIRCIIHTVGADSSWREIKLPNNNIYCLGFGMYRIHTQVLTSDGSLHWLTNCTTFSKSYRSHILSMEVNSEEFRTTRDPPAASTSLAPASLSWEDPYLFPLYHRPKILDVWVYVWVLEKYNKEVWVKKYCINPTIRLLWNTLPTASLYKGEVVIIKDRNGSEMFMYDPKFRKFKKLKAHGKFCSGLLLPVAHIDSLV